VSEKELEKWSERERGQRVGDIHTHMHTERKGEVERERGTEINRKGYESVIFMLHSLRCHNTQQNDIQHNDTQYNCTQNTIVL